MKHLRPKIFLCHATEDKPEVRKIYQQLKGLNLDLWFDEVDLLAGQIWKEEIPKILKSVDFVLVFFSLTSVSKKGYVNKELKIIQEVFDEFPEGDIFIIPARLNNCKLPSRYQNLHYCDLFHPGGLEKMLKAIQAQWKTNLNFGEKFNFLVDQQLLIDGYRLLKDNKIKEAEKKVDQYGINNENTPDYWYWKSRISEKSGNTEVALQYIDRAIKNKPYHTVSIALKIKLLLIKGGEYKNQALELFLEYYYNEASKKADEKYALVNWISILFERDILNSEVITERDIFKAGQMPCYHWEDEYNSTHNLHKFDNELILYKIYSRLKSRDNPNRPRLDNNISKNETNDLAFDLEIDHGRIFNIGNIDLHSSATFAWNNSIINSNFSNPKELIPIQNNYTPLPHDGLFIRRNNAYGTLSTVGIKDLIDKGVMIDQNNIRFDDFVDSDATAIASPKQGEGLAISYGLAEIGDQRKYHPDATHYLEIALKSSETPLEDDTNNSIPLPVNYMFVIDTSGSMMGEKIDMVRQAIRELFINLNDNDIIGLIKFSTNVNTLLKAAPKKDIDSNQFSTILGQIKPGGGTDINLGLSYGVDELERFRSHNYVNHIFLFSDGNSNSGEQNWLKIRLNIVKKLRGDITLSAFGFGSDANMRELEGLVGATGGQSVFVTHPNEVSLKLKEEITRREFLTAINIQLKINISEEVAILRFYGHDLVSDPAHRTAVLKKVEETKKESKEKYGIQSEIDIVTEEDGIKVFAPNMAIGEIYWIVLELGISKSESNLDIGCFDIQYNDIFKRKSKKQNFDFSKGNTIPSNLIIQHGIELWTSEVAYYALEDLYQKDLETANNRIEAHLSVLESINNKLSSIQIKDDIVTLKKLISLASNLGTAINYLDDLREPKSNSPSHYFSHQLNEFGQTRNGVMRANYILPFKAI